MARKKGGETLNIKREGRAAKDAAILVAPYARVSTEKEDQRNSLESQRCYFVSQIRSAPGLEMAGEYYDEGISGTSLKKRDSFNRMIADALAGQIDVIVTKEVSRFARNTMDVIGLTRQLKAIGVQVVFINDGINSFDPEGEFRLTIMAGMAQEESRKTSDRVKWGQTRRMEQGVVFGRSMLGYDVQGGKMNINPDGAQIVRLIFHKFLNEGKGAFSIARELENEGIRTYRGTTCWTAKVLFSVLRNEKYVGDLEQKKTYTPDFLSHDKKPNNGIEEKIYLKDHHEPIIPREMWDAVQAEIKRRGRQNASVKQSRYSHRYWCSGKLHCAQCGSRFMRRIRRLSNGQQRVAWICAQAVTHGKRKISRDGSFIGCDAQGMNEQALQYCVRYCIRQIPYHQERVIGEVLAEIAGTQQQKPTYSIGKLEHEVERRQDEKLKIMRLRVNEELTAAEFKALNEAISREIAELEEQVNKARLFHVRQQEMTQQIAGYSQRIQTILDGESESFLGEILEQVKVHQGGEVEVQLKEIPFSMRLRYVADGRGKNYAVRITHWEWVLAQKYHNSSAVTS